MRSNNYSTAAIVGLAIAIGFIQVSAACAGSGDPKTQRVISRGLDWLANSRNLVGIGRPSKAAIPRR